MGTSPEDILDEIQSYVVSCDNTVTYKWISQKWNVHVNTAKQLLYSFLEKEKSKENPLNYEVIYFLSGPLKDVDEGKSYQVCLVREKDVKKVKSKLQKVVSEHVYSIQKSTLKDLHTLYIVDKANGDKILQGKSGKSAVKCQDAVPRAVDLIVQAAPSTARDYAKGKDSLDKNSHKLSTDSSKSDADHQKGSKVNGEVSPSIGKGKKDVPKGIAGMFAAQGAKTSNKKSETDTENGNLKNNSIKPSGKKPNGIATLFAKQAERPPAQKPNKEEPKKKKEPEKVIVIEDEDPFASEDEEVVRKGLFENGMASEEDRCELPVERKGKEKTEKTKATKERKMKRPKHLDGEEESPLAIKKRRRIKMMSSSEESDEEEMEVGESESPIPETQKKSSKVAVSDDEDIIPATPQEAQGGPLGKKRMRKRVLINRTFADEQGYIVTKKEYVFESCTDDSADSGVEEKSLEEKAIPNGKLNHEKEVDRVTSEMSNKKDADADRHKDDVSSPGDESREKKGKDAAKGKKPVGKKISPPTGRQGVLTNFFKRS